jgi:hypothetical protein
MDKKKKNGKNEPPADRTKEQSLFALKKKVRMMYDLQRLRIQAAGRTKKKGEDNPLQLHEVDQAILDARAAELEEYENYALADVKEHLKTIPFYLAFLKEIKGIGPKMAGVVLTEFDIQREDTSSKMWRFAGLAPVPAKRCKECFRVVPKDGIHKKKQQDNKPIKCSLAGKEIPEDQMVDSAQAERPVAGKKLAYNKFLKTKLIGVLAPGLLKCNSPYRKFYDDYKHRKASANWGTNDGHRHNAAMRYMIKMLLLDIWKAWREFEGLEIRPSYQEQYLGHTHKEDDED